jgi:hypothetical protein
MKCCPNGGGGDIVIIYHLVIIYRQDPLFQLSSRVLRRIVLLLFSLVSFRERPVYIPLIPGANQRLASCSSAAPKRAAGVVCAPQSECTVSWGGFTRCAIPPLFPLRNTRFRESVKQIRTTMKIQTQMQQCVPSYPAESIPASRQRTTARKLVGNSPKAERKLDES